MHRRRARLASLAVTVALVGLWDLAIRTGAVDFETIPGPADTVEAWLEAVRSGQLVDALLHTLEVFAKAFVMATALGVVLGTAIGVSRTAYRFLHSTLEFLRFVPPVALIPVVLLITGFTDRSEVLIAGFASLWPILLNTATGVEQVDPQLRDVGRSLSMNRRQMLRKLVMPAAVPTIAVGLRIAMSLCLIMVVTTEIVAIPRGLGRELVTASTTLRPDHVYAYLLTIGVLGVLVNVGFRSFERRVLLRGWGPAEGEA